MGHCNGNCGSCSGCARELELSREELEFLKELGQIPFLPVARPMGEDTPIFPERDDPTLRLVLQCLEKKGLVSMDYDMPLAGCDYGSYPIRGSMALTARGQQVLELVEIQGIRE